MKRLVIAGAGTAGTIVANRMRQRVPRGWSVTVVDPEPIHLYQPGLLFLPFGAHDESKAQRRRAATLGRGVEWVRRGVAAVDPAKRRVEFDDASSLPYDLLVIASGARIRPDLTPGLDGDEWNRSIHQFYTLPGAQALRSALE